MLRKLMKHEFRATGRIMLPLFLILLVTAVGANLSTRGLLETEFAILDILGGLLVAAFAVAIAAVCIMSMVVMVRRFYKNLLQDEGYVMMTLPVSVHQQVWSKLIVSAVWFALTIVMVCAASLIMVFDIDIFKEIGGIFHEVFRFLTAKYALSGTALAAEFLLVCFLGSCVACLMVYSALAIGHSFPNHKMAWSVGWFFILQFAMQFLSGTVMTLLNSLHAFDWLGSWAEHMFQYADGNLNAMAVMHVSMASLMAVELVYGAVFYFLTTSFLKRHLNLE